MDWRIDSVRASYLLSGDRYADPLSPSQDILSSPNNVAGAGGRKYPREWALVAQDLCDAEAAFTYGLTHEGPPGLRRPAVRERSRLPALQIVQERVSNLLNR